MGSERRGGWQVGQEYGKCLAARCDSNPAHDLAWTWPPHLPQRMVGFRRSGRLQMMQVGAESALAAEEEVEGELAG